MSLLRGNIGSPVGPNMPPVSGCGSGEPATGVGQGQCGGHRGRCGLRERSLRQQPQLAAQWKRASYPIIPQTAKHWGSNLRYREWESVTPVPGSCFPLVFLSPSLSGQMPDAVTVVCPACLPVSPSLCGQMPDAVTLAPGLLSSCVSQSAML